MTLTANSKLGPYEIISAIGAGGMGEVYKAKDTRLDRIVAIKVLPSHVASNPDLRQRFDREAKAISSLNHPNICTLYDVGHQDGVDFLVMEYLEGETLSARLEKGPLHLSELLRYATEIADALDKAHHQGLVHRDLKPANVALTKSGAKLLDFGLAKLHTTGTAFDGAPTRTTPLTSEGAIVGTLQYMAPEQLEGKEADARSDIFSFGSTLYEMSTGKRAFDGKSQASVIASVLEKDPPSVSSLQPLTPPSFERVIKKCLEKDPDARWQSARDLCDELRWITHAGSQAGMPAPVAARRKFRLRAAWVIASLTTIAALALTAVIVMRPKAQVFATTFSVELPPGIRRILWPRISPDGRTLAFQGIDTAGTNRIYVRPLNSLLASPLPSTENVGRPFWSPDSRYLAFFHDGQLKKIAIAGGPPQLIGGAKGGADGSWGSQNIIVFDGAVTDSVRRISASGGDVSAASQINRSKKEQYHMWPMFLPDGRHFLYGCAFTTSVDPNSGFELRLGELDSYESKTLFRADSRIEYDPRGYILYVADNTLFARRFNEQKLEVVGDAFPIVEKVFTNTNAAQFSVSNGGTLTYLPSGASSKSELVWLDRSGREISKLGSPDLYGDIHLSPDGSKLAYDIYDQQGSNADIWILDLTRNVPTRLTFEPKLEVWPLWSPDGSEIIYSSNNGGDFKAFRKSVSGLTDEKPAFPNDSSVWILPSSWSSDGNRVACLTNSRDQSGGPDAIYIDLSAGFSRNIIAATKFGEVVPVFSPDGNFAAYMSDESGIDEIYVREIGGANQRWQITTGGGSVPTWRHDGRELFYLNGDAIWSVPITMKPAFRVESLAKLFDIRLSFRGTVFCRFQPSSDGQRILVNRRIDLTTPPGPVVIQNWDADIAKH